MSKKPAKMSRRDVLKQSAALAAACAAGLGVAGCGRRSRPGGGDRQRVIVVGIDGMDPRLPQTHDERRASCPTSTGSAAAAGSARWAPASRRRAPWPGPASSTAPGPGSHGIFDFIHRHPEQPVRPVLRRRRDAARPKAAGTSASTGCNCRSGRSTTSRRPPCCGGRACPSGTTSTSAASRPRSTTCPATIRPAPRSMATTVACRAWARPTCSAPTAPTSTLPRTVPPKPATKQGGKRSGLSFEDGDGQGPAGRAAKTPS